MNPLWSSVAVLTVSALYYAWKEFHFKTRNREEVLRERVAYMLWVMADQVEEEEDAPSSSVVA